LSGLRPLPQDLSGGSSGNLSPLLHSPSGNPLSPNPERRLSLSRPCLPPNAASRRGPCEARPPRPPLALSGPAALSLRAVRAGATEPSGSGGRMAHEM
ncbi:hypothetical protein CT0861_07196, partial [Colletotrichum tofieldiae]